MDMIAEPARALSLEERSAILGRILASDTASGWRVESQTATQAQLVKGKHTSHLLHLVLTILTLGLWLIVWILVALLGGQKQRFVMVDEFGRVTRR